MRKQIFAQMPTMPPMAGPPGGDPMGGMGAPPMGGMGAPPMGGAVPQAPRQPITGPLKSVGEILYDYNAEEYIALHPEKTEEEIAQEIWDAYGGTADGTIDPHKLGERSEAAAQNLPEVAQKEFEATEETKWKRLPAGKSVQDVISLDELAGLIKSLTYGTVKKFRTPPAPPGGGMPPMAESNKSMQKLASELREDLKKLRKYMK